MSFEAVPYKVTCRSEDGSEAPLFGLLIRPSNTTPYQAASNIPIKSSASLLKKSATATTNLSNDLPPILPKNRRHNGFKKNPISCPKLPSSKYFANEQESISALPFLHQSYQKQLENMNTRIIPSFSEASHIVFPQNVHFNSQLYENIPTTSASYSQSASDVGLLAVSSCFTNKMPINAMKPYSNLNGKDNADGIQSKFDAHLLANSRKRKRRKKLPQILEKTNESDIVTSIAGTSYNHKANASGVMTQLGCSHTTVARASATNSLRQTQIVSFDLDHKFSQVYSLEQNKGKIENTYPAEMNHYHNIEPLINQDNSSVFLPSPNSTLPPVSSTTITHQQVLHSAPIWCALNSVNQGAMPLQFSSSTPDSGIQSIDGSPPSIVSCTPPLVSPCTATVAEPGLVFLSGTNYKYDESTTTSAPQVVNGIQIGIETECTALEETLKSTAPSNLDTNNSSDDFSDMPKLRRQDCSTHEEHPDMDMLLNPNSVTSMPSVELFDEKHECEESQSLELPAKSDAFTLSESGKTSEQQVNRPGSKESTQASILLSTEKCSLLIRETPVEKCWNELEQYRLMVRKKLSQRIAKIFDAIEEQLRDMHLSANQNCPPKSLCHFKPLNWADVRARIHYKSLKQKRSIVPPESEGTRGIKRTAIIVSDGSKSKKRACRDNELTTTSKTNTRSNDPSLLKIRIKRQTKKIAYDEKSVTPKEVFKEKTSSDKKTPGSDESKIIQHAHIFLIRNVRAQKAADNFSSQSNIKLLTPTATNRVQNLLVEFLRFCSRGNIMSRRMRNHLRRIANLALRNNREDSNERKNLSFEVLDLCIKECLLLFKNSLPTHSYESICNEYSRLKGPLNRVKDKEVQQISTEERKRMPIKRDSRVLNVDFDLSYMDSPTPVGKYDPDVDGITWTLSDDCVRCICGCTEDGGSMIQCDKCYFWLHMDCHDSIDQNRDEYFCELCTREIRSAPKVDVVLRPQPSIRLQNCVYYKTLVTSSSIQVRLNETVYVERLINDKHKNILRTLHEECVSVSKVEKNSKRQQRKDKVHRDSNSELPKNNLWWPEPGKKEPQKEFHRKDLRVFRVERLFVGPNGERFIFGCYYARPHETFCDPSRNFHRNELFWTPFFDTLPLDAVVGRCLVLDPSQWQIGRPKFPKYLEEDVFLCEYQIDKNQRSFEKAKNHYHVNAEPYIFEYFKGKIQLKREFSPFVLPASGLPNKPSESIIPASSREVCMCNLEMICSRLSNRLSRNM